MIYSRVVGTGSYLPAKILTNAELEKMVDTTDEWIVERVGIHERHIAADDETASTLAKAASLKAIEAAGIQASEIDFIIVATSTSDKIFPSTACLLQKSLGIAGCPAFDVTAACAGFNYVLSVADQYIRTGQARCALVVGSEVMSRIIDWTDRSTCILFADGAGAVILKASDEPGILSTHLHADGQYQDLLYTPNGLQVNEQPFMKMVGSSVFKVAVKQLSQLVDETLAANHIDKSKIDWLIPHQANRRIISAMAEKLQLSMDRVVVTIGEHGNTSAASVPLALDTAVRDGRIKLGDLLLLESFGGGFTWGSALIKY
jgi:3-oxoacyl-[acyl-carrier-protein] synthase III